jgi:hypothetical protein
MIGAACRWTVIRCREAAFQQFLGVTGNEAAAARVRELCEVESRVELDRDSAAQARWNERVRLAYMNYQESKQ